MRSLSVGLLVTALTITACGSVFAAASVNAGKLIITEVSFRDAANDWVELYVVDGSISWAGYRIYVGILAKGTLPSGWSLSTGDYIVLHEELGTDDVNRDDNNVGYWDLYGMGDLKATDNIVQLKEPSGSAKRVDAVIWSDNNANFTGSDAEANGAVDDGMWDAGAYFNGKDSDAWTDSDDISSGQSLARYLDPGTPVYVDNNSKADWYRSTSPSQGDANDVSLPITLSSFTAFPGDGQVVLRWITESEIDNLGFNVYRSLEEDGAYMKITGELIPGAGSSPGRSVYSFTDGRLINGQTYYYKLEDVSFDGKHTFRGPIKAIPKAVAKGEEEASGEGEGGHKSSRWGEVKDSLKSGDERN